MLEDSGHDGSAITCIERVGYVHTEAGERSVCLREMVLQRVDDLSTSIALADSVLVRS